jgi:hypothetical protein
LYWEAEEKDVNVGAKEWADRGADLREFYRYNASTRVLFMDLRGGKDY